MNTAYSVSLSKIIDAHGFEVVYAPEDLKNRAVISPDVNRPSLIFMGFEKYFDAHRLQFIGAQELDFITHFSDKEIDEKAKLFFSLKPVAVILTRGLEFPESFLKYAEEYSVPLLRTQDATSSIMSSIISYLNVELAPRITRHGVFVEVHGEGVLILGESGVGKSETALELIKRGHRLIADDAVDIRRTSSRTLVGSAPDNIRHFIELRGVGIINARRIFGVGAVKLTERIDMVIQLEPWEEGKTYERLGLDCEYTDILGIKVPISVVPVQPGRNLSIIIEAAAMNNRQRKMGYNAARQLLHNLGMDEIAPDEKELDIWHDF
ncbi:MAG: HPr(Ser) kinase/phosphatase [Clostridia bacterium]|nr:HPr(Ser) kinase/phosphatase [Clostridia bacterium]